MHNNPATPGRPLRLYSKDARFFDASTDFVVGKKMNFFKGWVCGAGVQNLHVNMDGDVFGASCRVGGSLGNIFENINLPQEWVTCTKNVCSCGADHFVAKAKDIESKKYLINTMGVNKNLPLVPGEKDDHFVAMEPGDSKFVKQVYWEIGRRCNYDCSYCFPSIHNKTDPHKSLETLLRATMLVEELFCKSERVHFVISGGEPTLNPALMDWVKFLSSLGHWVSMHTNGSRHHSYYQELIEYTNLNISVHFDFINEDKLFKTIKLLLDKKIKLKNKGVGHLEIKLMAGPDKINEVLKFEENLRNLSKFKDFCTWAIVPIREGTDELVVEGYKDSDFELFGDRV